MSNKEKPESDSNIIQRRVDTVLSTPVPTKNEEGKLSESYLKKNYPDYKPKNT